MNKYTISTHQEETDCTYCGAPLYVGDTAYMRDDEQIVCSRNCSVELDLFSGEGPRCPACDGGMSNFLGILGNLIHFRCVFCGWEFSQRIELA